MSGFGLNVKLVFYVQIKKTRFLFHEDCKPQNVNFAQQEKNENENENNINNNTIFAWNFIQSGVFVAITSGNEQTSSLLTAKITGSPLITGGEFGPEGTIQAIIFCALAAIILLQKSKENIRPPYWKKTKLLLHLIKKKIT